MVLDDISAVKIERLDPRWIGPRLLILEQVSGGNIDHVATRRLVAVKTKQQESNARSGRQRHEKTCKNHNPVAQPLRSAEAPCAGAPSRPGAKGNQRRPEARALGQPLRRTHPVHSMPGGRQAAFQCGPSCLCCPRYAAAWRVVQRPVPARRVSAPASSSMVAASCTAGCPPARPRRPEKPARHATDWFPRS